MVPSSSGQDAGLSRRKPGFDSRWDYHTPNGADSHPPFFILISVSRLCVVKIKGTILLYTLLALVGYACTSGIITDSGLTGEEAIYSNQPPGVMASVQEKLAVVDVRYYGFDGRIHQGQIVIHEALAADILQIFDVILQTRFPVESVLPIAHPLIQRKAPFGLSSDTNNTSGYAWRPVTACKQLSMHALGLAVDINPRRNPYISGALVLPPRAIYEPSAPGTLTSDSPVVLAFKQRGWEWGGDWKERRVDYMHFQKIPPGWEQWTGLYREESLLRMPEKQ